MFDLNLYLISCRGFKLKIYEGFGHFGSRHGSPKEVAMSRFFMYHRSLGKGQNKMICV